MYLSRIIVHEILRKHIHSNNLMTITYHNRLIYYYSKSNVVD